MVRTPSYDKNGIKKGAWSSDEDQKLRAYIVKNGPGNWRELPKFAGLKRCGKSCRLRWMNYLRPDLKHGKYTKEEEDLIIQLHESHGKKWAMIASKLPGRTDNEIKNYWHTHLKKRVGQQGSTRKPTSKIQNLDDHYEASNSQEDPNSDPSSSICHDIQILESCPMQSQEIPTTITSEFSFPTIDSSSFEISTSNVDEEALGGMIDTSDIFAELSSLISPFEHQTSDSGSSISRTTSVVDENGGINGNDFWADLFRDGDDGLLSPHSTYYNDDFFHLCYEEMMQARSFLEEKSEYPDISLDNDHLYDGIHK